MTKTKKKKKVFFSCSFQATEKFPVIYTKGLCLSPSKRTMRREKRKNAATTYLCFCFRMELFSTPVIQCCSSESARRRRVKGSLYRKQLEKDKGPHLIEASPRTTRWLTGAAAGAAAAVYKNETRSMPCVMGNDL